MKAIYPEYVFSVLLCLPFYLKMLVEGSVSVIQFLLNSILNLTLLQSWLPKMGGYVITFNNATWFLSAISFCYLLTGVLFKVLKRIHPILVLIGIIVIQHVLFYLIGIEKEVSLWFQYQFPMTRIMDYCLGMCIAAWSEQAKTDRNYGKPISDVMLVVLLCLYALVVLKSSSIHPAYHLLEIGIFCLVVLPSAGAIKTHIFDNWGIVYLGNISSTLFLFHLPVIWYSHFFWQRTPLSGYESIEFLFLLSSAIAATVIFSLLKQKITKKNR